MRHYGGGVMSLLRERSTTYEFTGEDYRSNQQQRTLREAEQGLIRPVVIA